MDGYTKVASGWVGTVSGAWQVVRLGDHNGDGLADILWNKPGTGDIVIWEMNALVRETAGLVDSAPGWVAQ